MRFRQVAHAAFRRPEPYPAVSGRRAKLRGENAGRNVPELINHFNSASKNREKTLYRTK